jgi:hypothetical protein
MTGDASDACVCPSVSAGEVERGGGQVPGVFLFVEMAGHTEAIVAFLRRKAAEKHHDDDDSAANTRDPQNEAPGRQIDGGVSMAASGLSP